LKLASNHLGVGVGKAEEGAGVIGLEIDHLASLRGPPEISGQGRIPAKLAVEREAPDRSIAPR
jgi:hypothetical protein